MYAEGEGEKERETETESEVLRRERESEGGRERVNNMLCYGGSAEVIKGRS